MAIYLNKTTLHTNAGMKNADLYMYAYQEGIQDLDYGPSDRKKSFWLPIFQMEMTVKAITGWQITHWAF